VLNGAEGKNCKTVNWWATTLDLRGVAESGGVSLHKSNTEAGEDCLTCGRRLEVG